MNYNSRNRTTKKKLNDWQRKFYPTHILDVQTFRYCVDQVKSTQHDGFLHVYIIYTLF